MLMAVALKGSMANKANVIKENTTIIFLWGNANANSKIGTAGQRKRPERDHH